MATDTPGTDAPPPAAAPVAAPAPPTPPPAPAAAATPPAPPVRLSQEGANEALSRAFARARTPAPKATIDTQEGTPLSSKGDTTAPATAPADRTAPPPAADPAAPGERSEAQAAASEAPPSPAATSTPPVPPTTSPVKAEAPAENDQAQAFADQRWQQAFSADPLLKRTASRLANDPTLSPAQKATKLLDKLVESEGRAAQATRDTRDLAHMRRTDPVAYAETMEQREQIARMEQQQAQRVTLLIAQALGVDENDPAFLEAGPRDGDTSYEQGMQRFQDFVRGKSAFIADARTQGETTTQQRYEAQIETLKADHERALKDARKQWEDEKATAVDTARAEARAGLPSAPRAGLSAGALPPGTGDTGPAHAAPTNQTAFIRSALRTGLQRPAN